MFSGTCVILLSIVAESLSTAPFQAQASAKDIAEGKPTTAATLDALIERAKEMKAFVAEYRVTSEAKNKSGTMRLAYQKDRGIAWTIESPGSSAQLWILDDQFTGRFSSEGGSTQTFSIDIQELVIAPHDSLADGFEAAFPKAPRRKADIDEFQPVFSVDYRKNNEPGNRFNFAAGLELGSSVLGWLSWLKANAPEGREHGDTLTYTIDDGVRFNLSKESGFLTSIEKTEEGRIVSSLALEKLDLGPSIEKSELEPRAGGEGAIDNSAAARAECAARFLASDRDWICGWLKTCIQDKRIAWDEKSRAKLSPLFVEMHRQRIGAICRAGIESSQAKSDEFITQLETQLARPEHEQEEWRRALDKQIDEWVSGWNSSLDDARDSYASRMCALPAHWEKEDLRPDLETMLAAAAKQAFESEVMKPLIDKLEARLDEALAAAGENPRPRK
jgi:hypothetical protein